MKKITREPDYFEVFAMQTLSKVNKMGSYVHGVTIGPNSTYRDEEDSDDEELRDDVKSISSMPAANVRKYANDEEKDRNTLFLYASKALHEMEDLRQLNVTNEVNERVSKLIHLEDELFSRMSENLKLLREEMDIKEKLKSKIIENSIHNEDLVVSQKMYELIKRYTDEKLKSEEKSAYEAQLKKDEDVKLRNERIHTLSQIQEEYREIHKQILDNTMNCKNRSKLISQNSSDFQKVQELTNNFNDILKKVNLDNVEDQDVETCRITLQCISIMANKLKNNAELINFEEEERIARELQAADIKEDSLGILSEVIEENRSENSKKSENEICLEDCICRELLEYYSVLCEQLNELSKHVETFVNSLPSRTFLRKLKMVVATPVNSVTQDTAHMRDKFIKISQVLKGNVSLPDTLMPNFPKDSLFVFLIDDLCKRIIFHATRFSLTSPREAYLLASFALAVWNEFPEFGPILIAHIMQKCPYAIPAYWPKYSDQSDQEYFMTLGYKYKNDEIEDETSYTNRMIGIFMFYVSLMITPGTKNRPHPHGLENAWRWIAALLNLEPRRNVVVVTAELLHVFLETCGYKMNQYYGIQFQKIVQLLQDEYIAKIEKITPPDRRGPVSRLENLLQKGFVAPKDVLSADEWL